MHRIGRAGRAGSKGVAYTIYQENIDNQIARLSRKNIV
jgi:superfamily II DNA/RNA helicase